MTRFQLWSALTLVAIAFSTSTCEAQLSKALSATMKVLIGGTAAYSAERAKHSMDEMEKASQDAAKAAVQVAKAKAKEVEFESFVLNKLRSQGYDASQDVVYSVYFTLNNDASSVYWADTISRADVYFCLDLEGHGTHLVPDIRYGYNGSPVLNSVIAREVRPGNKIVVRVLDDDSLSNAVWRSLLETRVKLDVGMVAFLPVPVMTHASGELQLLSKNSRVVVSAPDEIAAVTVTVPNTEDGTWLTKGELKDGSGRIVGAIQIACIWSARGERKSFDARVAAERARMSAEQLALEENESSSAKQAAKSGSQFWLWAVAGTLAAIWFVVYVVMDAVSGKPDKLIKDANGTTPDKQ